MTKNGGKEMKDDVKLSAMLDGELGAEEQTVMEATLSKDAQMQARLSQMRQTDDAVRAAFAAPIEEAVPDRFLKAIDAGFAAHDARAQTNVIPLKPIVKEGSNDNKKGFWRMGGAIAASLALGLLLAPQIMTRDSGEISSLALNKALNTVPSTQTASLSKGKSITPQLSFAKAGGGYCRQFTLTAETGAKSGVACTKDGNWVVEALLPSAQATSAEDGYVTAEGPSNAGLDTAIGALRAGDPLDRSAEAALIARGWH
jgi:negative regulator of sigma E activity